MTGSDVEAGPALLAERLAPLGGLVVVDATEDAHLRTIIQAAMVPLSLGLIAASAFVIAQVAAPNWRSAGLIAGTGLLTYWLRLNPLWIFLAAALLGAFGVV